MSLDFQFLNDFPLPLCVQHVIHRKFVERDRMTACSTVCCLSNSLLHTRLLDATNKQVYTAVNHYYTREICGFHGSPFWDSTSCCLKFTFQRILPCPSSEMNVCVVLCAFYRFPRQMQLTLNHHHTDRNGSPLSRVCYQQ